jgi:tripartite-type tricarboxylate transporter receptor subunit TctC
VIGAQAVLSALPDGYTLLYTVASTFTVLPAQNDKLTFDVNRDLIPIGLTGAEGMVLAVSPKLGVNTLSELIALAKEHPYKFIIGTNPAGSLPHLAGRMFVSLSQAPMTVVPSTGGTNEAIREIMGGRGHAVIEGLPGLVRSRRGRPQGACDHDTCTSAHSPRHTHSGGNIARAYCGRVGGTLRTQGTPQAIVQQLSEDLRKALEDPDFRARFETIGSTPFQAIYTAELARFIESDQKLWWPVVKDAELK